MIFGTAKTSLLIACALTSSTLSQVTQEVQQTKEEKKRSLLKELVGLSDKECDELYKKSEEHKILFSNIRPEDKQKFWYNLQTGQQLIKKGQSARAYYHLIEAQSVYKYNNNLLSCIGAVQLDLRNFDEAKRLYLDLVKLNPLGVTARYNLGETQFVLKRYDKAYHTFTLTKKLAKLRALEQIKAEKLKRKKLKERGEFVFKLDIKRFTESPLIQITEFKIMLSLLGKHLDNEAAEANKAESLVLYKELQQKLSKKKMTLNYYYANATECFRLGNKKEGTRWTQDALKVFPKMALHEAWVDALVEFGYIKSYYGGEGAGKNDSKSTL